MATLSPLELLDWLGQYQFLAAVQIDELRPLLPSFPDSMAIAKELIRRDWLTPYQVNQIMQGKHAQLVLSCYRLRERIGEGAMGQVFKAWNLRLERVVAVKTLTKALINNDKAMERFRREVATASQLDHPNIVTVRDAGEEDGRPFLVMDFIDGINLSQQVKQQGALPIHEAVEYARQTALGLQHAFERGIVHRDIKPANLIVTTAKNNGDNRPLVKILDFGLARFESEGDSGARLTQVGKTLGTIDYISPEQAQDSRNADIRADIYSLGCSLYYLLTAQPPFPGNDVVEKLGPRVTGEPPWVRAVRADVPPQLEEVLRKIMARRPEERFQTPIEVAQALEPFAMPLATAQFAPAAGEVLMAMPVTAGAIVPADDVPMAMPVYAAAASESAHEEDPSFLGMSATGRDLSSGAAAARPREVKKKPFPIKLVVALGGGAFFVSLLICLGIFAFNYFGGIPQKPEGTLRITKAVFSTPEIEPGDRKRILVYIERTNFKGPVTLTLADLPQDVNSSPYVIPASVNEGDIVFNVSFNIEPGTTPIRVHAECEKEGITADYPLTLVIVKQRRKK